MRLSTYAIWWIKAAINDFILRSWSLVKIGTVAAQKKLFYNLGRIKAKLGIYENKELEPSVVKQIAGELVVDEKDVVEMNRRLGGDSSLNVTVGDEEDEREKSTCWSTSGKIWKLPWPANRKRRKNTGCCKNV